LLWTDLAALVGAAILVLWLSRSEGLRNLLPGEDCDVLVALLLATCAASAAILAATVHWLSNDRRAVWMSAAGALYAVVAVSAELVTEDHYQANPVTAAVRFSAHLCGGLLVAVAVAPPTRRHWLNPLSLSVVGLTVVAAAAVLATVAPDTVSGVVTWVPARTAVGLGVVVVGVALVVVGQAEQARGLSRVGLAMTVLALARIWRMAIEGPGVPIAAAGMELLAAFVALWGLKQLAGGAFRAMRRSEIEHVESLRRARIGLAKAVDRDLELRAGLVELAEATQLLGESPAEEAQSVRRAVDGELTRLEKMMAEDGMRPDPRPYAVGAVIRDVVALRRCAGMDIRCDGDDGSRAVGSPSVLTQVVTNVVANSARHAPGSPVRLRAYRRGDRIRLRISDLGPGIPPGSEAAVFGHGTRSPTTGGQGLGLHICRQLLAAEGGKIEIRSTPAIRPGCTVIVDLPAVVSSGTRGDLVPSAHAS
jgi:two-component system OmpR family sensor kinase